MFNNFFPKIMSFVR